MRSPEKPKKPRTAAKPKGASKPKRQPKASHMADVTSAPTPAKAEQPVRRASLALAMANLESNADA